RRGRDASSRVSAPDIVLRLFREMRQDAGMVGRTAQTQGRRPAGRFAELDRDIERYLVVVLVTAPAFWLERVNQAGGKVFVDRLLWNVAIALGFHGALAQPGRQRTSADDEFVGSRNIVRCGGRSQFGQTHGISSRLAKDCARSRSRSRTTGANDAMLAIVHRLRNLSDQASRPAALGDANLPRSAILVKPRLLL